MDLTLFIVFEAISLILVILGYWTGERAYSLFGFAFLFILGSGVILPGNLEVKTGETEAYNYICQSCIGSTFPDPAGNTSQVSSIVKTYDFTNWNNATSKFFGLWQVVLGAVGIAITTAEIKKAFG